MSRRRLAPVPAHYRPRSPLHLWNACCAGTEPAEALDPRDREDLLVQLRDAGWTVERIGEHTRTTDYTVRRILERCAHQRDEAAARAWTARTRREPAVLRCRTVRTAAAA